MRGAVTPLLDIRNLSAGFRGPRGRMHALHDFFGSAVRGGTGS